MKKKQRERFFNPETIVSAAREGVWIEVHGDSLSGLATGDMLLVDRARKPRKGDYVVWGSPGGFTLGCFDGDDPAKGRVWATGVTIVRKLTPKRKAKAGGHESTVAALENKLERLERLPENEAERFKLESEIFQLNHAARNEWPDVIVD